MGKRAASRLIVIFSFLAVLNSLLGGSALAAASPATVTLPGHVPTEHLKGAKDLGAVVGGTPLTLLVGLKGANAGALERQVAARQTRGSPDYGKAMTPAQVGAQLGASASQINSVTAFLRGQGLTVGATVPYRLFISASGTAAQVERAFGVQLHRFRAPDGTTFRAPLQDPRIPAALSGVVGAVFGLDSVPLAHPEIQRPNIPPSVAPQGLTPDQIRSAYGLLPAYSSGVDGTPITGSGQTLGLMELDDYLDSDITTYEQNAASAPLPAVQVTRVPIAGFTPTRGDGADEVTLDIDMLIALAPGTTASPSTILVYEAPNSNVGLLENYLQIATQDRASTVSTSWGMCEQASPVVPLVATYEFYIFLAMALQQQSIFAASGDTGAYACETTAQTSGPLTVDDPASDPLVAAVGGTHLNLDSSGSAYASETAWSGPSCHNYGTDAAPELGPCGGGGGLSSLWPQMDWMTGPGVANSYSNGHRQVPDVALDADPNNGSGYGIYYTDPSSGVYGWDIIGGTSAAAPLWAAWAALSNQYASVVGKPRLGLATPVLYAIASNPTLYASDFHDVPSGSTNGYYPTTANYDLATGLGSFNGWNLLTDVNAVLGPPTPAVKGISPASGPTSGGTAVTISGINFTGATAVMFGTVAATSFTVNSPLSISAVSPAESAGTGDVSVTTSSGTSPLNPSADQFTFGNAASAGPWPMFHHDPQHTGRGVATGPSSPTLQWSYMTDDGVDSSPAVGVDGTVYVNSADEGGLYALSPGGSLKWSYSNTSIEPFSSPAIGPDGTVYYGGDVYSPVGSTYYPYLVAISPGGTLKWRFQASSEVTSSPTITADGSIYYGTDDGYLNALTESGTLKWRYQTGAQEVWSSPAIGADGSVYASDLGGSLGGYVFALTSAGALKWQYQIGGTQASPSIGADGTIYIGSGNGYLYAFNPTGALKWRYQTGGIGVSSAAIGTDGTIYVGSEDDYVYAITPDGALKWRYQTGDQVISSPAIGGDGTIYVGSYDGFLYALDASGDLKWRYPVGGGVSSPAVGADGTVYVGSSTDFLYAIGPGASSSPALHGTPAAAGKRPSRR